MLGFDFEEDVPTASGRAALAQAIDDLAHEFLGALRAEPVHEDLSFVPRLEKEDVAFWVASHYVVHDLARRALGEPAPQTLALDLAPDLDAAARGWTYSWRIQRLENARKRSPGPSSAGADVERRRLRREQLELWLTAGRWVVPAQKRSRLYELADLDEAAHDLAGALSWTERAVALEDSELGRTTALELVAHRKELFARARR